MKKLLSSIPRMTHRKIRMPTPGSRPGTLAVLTELPPPVVRRITYDAGSEQSADVALDDLESALNPRTGQVVWVDVQGLGDADALLRMGAALGLHPLTIEDIAHVHQRPKVEEFDDYLFVTLRDIRLTDDGRIDDEQVSLVLKGGLLVTFQEQLGDGFDPIRRRIREGKGAIRKSGADYLAAAIIDAVIDNYFPVLEAYGDHMDQLDDQVRAQPTHDASRAIHHMRKQLRLFRRATWPFRDVTSKLGRDDYALIADEIRPMLRDCHDHVIQVADFVDGARERSAELADLYMAVIGERTNQVMKVLTIIATIFIPLTFLAGIYGMNFDPEASPFNMPELKWKYGYPAFWGVLVAVLLLMLWFFHRQGWVGKDNPDEGGDDQEH